MLEGCGLLMHMGPLVGFVLHQSAMYRLMQHPKVATCELVEHVLLALLVSTMACLCAGLSPSS